MIKLRDKCSGCKKTKWFVRYRVFTPKAIGQPVTSNGKLCGKCFKTIKQMVK